MSDKTKLAKAHGLLADAYSELCGLMNAFQYDGMQPDVAGPWFDKVMSKLETARSAYGIGGKVSKSKTMTMEQFELHLGMEYGAAKKDKPAVAKQRLMLLQQAIGIAKASFKKPGDTAEIPLFEVAKTESETPPVTEPAAPAPTTTEDPTNPGTKTTATTEQVKTEESAGEGGEQPMTEEQKAQQAKLEEALGGLGKRVNALDVLGFALEKQAKQVGSIDELMDAHSWPDDMASEASMRGDDPQDTISKADDSFGVDPWVQPKAKPQVTATPAAK